jgi:diguanylate cyclase (GGDEF)-like protein
MKSQIKNYIRKTIVEKSVKQLYANIGKLITSSLEFDQILQGIMKEVHIFFKPEYWSLLRLDEATDELFFVIFNGPVHLNNVKDIRLKNGEGIAGLVVENKLSYFVPDTSKDKKFSDKVDIRTGFTTKSIIAVPLIYREKVYGVIEVINPVDGTLFSEEELFILQTIADFSAIAFANAALYENLIILSQTDSLTGTYNRLKFEQLTNQWEASDPHRRSFEKEYISAIVVDLNDFKEINDSYGHMVGDRVLKAAAIFFKSCIRGDDILFRLGGDEFLIMIQSAMDNQLISATERIIQLLKQGNEQKLVNNIQVSYSFGYGSGKRKEIKKVVEEADYNMYLSKKKNTVSAQL